MMTFDGLDLLGADDMAVGFTPGAVRAAALPAETPSPYFKDWSALTESALSAVSSPTEPKQRAIDVNRPVALKYVMPEGVKRQDTEHRMEKGKIIGAMNTVMVAGLVGAVGGGIGGALLWPAQRFLGALLGSVVVGAPAGAAVGTLLVMNEAKRT